MKILAIDPGPSESAYVVWIVPNETIQDFGHVANRDLLVHIRQDHYNPDMVFSETIQCMGMPAGQEMFMTMFWNGRFCEATETQIHGPPFNLVKRSDVKMHLCQSMRAKDANIRQALIDRFGKPGTKKAPGRLFGIANHLWSALAIAVTAADKLRKEP